MRTATVASPSSIAARVGGRAAFALLGLCTALVTGCGDDVAPGTRPCALDRALIDASHVVSVNGSSGVVESVDVVRASDPRAGVFDGSPLTPGDAPIFTRDDGVDGFSDAGPEAVALIGQPRTDLPDEWSVHAVAMFADGALVFVGPCAAEFDRQFAAVQQAFDGSADAAFLGRMVDEALLPGRGADLRNIAAPPGSGANVVTDPLAPRWADRVRVVSVTIAFTPQGRAGAAEVQSEVGFYGIGVGSGLTVSTMDVLAAVPLQGRVQVVVVDDAGEPLGAPLDIADTACADALAMYVSVDLDDLTSWCTPAVDTRAQARVDEAQRALRFDDTVAIPDYADGPPSQE